MTIGGELVDLSDLLFTNEAYQLVSKYIAPEMLIVIPILIFLSWLMKQTPNFKDWLIPYVVSAFGIIAGVVITKSLEDGFIQGILVAAISIIVPVLVAQMKKKKADAAKKEKENEKAE